MVQPKTYWGQDPLEDSKGRIENMEQILVGEQYLGRESRLKIRTGDVVNTGRG